MLLATNILVSAKNSKAVKWLILLFFFSLDSASLHKSHGHVASALFNTESSRLLPHLRGNTTEIYNGRIVKYSKSKQFLLIALHSSHSLYFLSCIFFGHSHLSAIRFTAIVMAASTSLSLPTFTPSGLVLGTAASSSADCTSSQTRQLSFAEQHHSSSFHHSGLSIFSSFWPSAPALSI